jgi:hypothetical protein
MCPAVLPKNLISIDANRLVSFFFYVSKFRFHIKERGQPVQRIKSGNRTTGLPSSMPVTRLNVKTTGRPNDRELFVVYVRKFRSFLLRVSGGRSCG